MALINRGQVIALDTPDGLKARARTSSLTNPTMEDAFVTLVQAQDAAYERDRVA